MGLQDAALIEHNRVHVDAIEPMDPLVVGDVDCAKPKVLLSAAQVDLAAHRGALVDELVAHRERSQHEARPARVLDDLLRPDDGHPALA